MRRCEFTPEARSDLQEIHDYIAQDSPTNATRFIDRLEQQCQRLAEMPYIGISREDLSSELRSFVAGRYLIFYRATHDGAEIIRVVHGSRNLQRLFEQDS